MNANNKEKVFEKLRSYHLEQFPDKIQGENLNNFRIALGTLEDNIITMILSLIDGRTKFTDFTPELNSFQEKFTRTTTGDSHDDAIKNLFISKINQLSDILATTKKFNFTLKPVRAIKVTAVKS